MLNTKKLLYIFPDLAYVVDLLPTKKEHTFSIQSFRQINGELLKNDAFVPERVAKLFAKLDQDEYHLILPDFMFTNTIVNVEEESDEAIAQHIKSSLLPNLNLSQKTHQIATTVLTQFKGTAKVQLSALEHELLSPIRDTAKKNNVVISGISSLSWTLKSSISLEPSISVLQIGSNLYSALHYIGVDQTNLTTIDDVSVISETIKTLKGAEPSIQTIYLLSNAVVEEQLKELLSDTLPIQQLTVFKEEDTKMPSYVKQIIESGMKTLAISDFPVPVFTLQLLHETTIKKSDTSATDTEDTPAQQDMPEQESQPDKVEEENTQQTASHQTTDLELPKPSVPSTVEGVTINSIKAEPATDTDSEVKKEKEEVKIQDSASHHEKQTEIKKELPSTNAEEHKETAMPDEPQKPEVTSIEKPSSTPTATPASPTPVVPSASTPSPSTAPNPPAAIATPTTTGATAPKPAVDVSQFAQQPTPAAVASPNQTATPAPTTKEKKVIKNKSGVQSMLKMVFITLAVFAVTVAVGIGVGMGILSFSEKEEPPVAVPEVIQETTKPAESVVPESTESAEVTDEVVIDPEEYSILVVNATAKAGYAGEIKSLLDDAELGTVAASNAKGEYDEGIFLLMSEEVPGLLEFVAEATDLEVVEGTEDSTIEDTKDAYDAVLVLAE